MKRKRQHRHTTFLEVHNEHKRQRRCQHYTAQTEEFCGSPDIVLVDDLYLCARHINSRTKYRKCIVSDCNMPTSMVYCRSTNYRHRAHRRNYPDTESHRPLKRRHTESTSDFKSKQLEQVNASVRLTHLQRVEDVRQSLRDRKVDLIGRSQTSQMSRDPSAVSKQTDTRLHYTEYILEHTTLPRDVADIINEYVFNPIMAVYGTASTTIVLTDDRTAVILESMEVMCNVQKICVTVNECYVLTYDGVVYCIYHDILHPGMDNTFRFIADSVKDILCGYSYVIMLKSDRSLYSCRMHKFGGKTIHDLNISVDRIQHIIDARYFRFAGIINNKEDNTETTYFIYRGNIVDELTIQGAVSKLYFVQSNFYVVLDTTGRVTTTIDKYNEHLDALYANDHKYSLQDGVVDISVNRSGFVARKDTGTVITVFRDLPPIHIPYKMKKVLSTNGNWWGLTKDEVTVIHWNGTQVTTLDTKGRPIKDICIIHNTILIIFKGGGFMRVEPTLDVFSTVRTLETSENLDEKIPTFQSMDITVYNSDLDQLHMSANDRKGGTSHVLGVWDTYWPRMYVTTVNTGTIRQIYSTDVSHLRHVDGRHKVHTMLFEDGTVDQWDIVFNRQYDDQMYRSYPYDILTPDSVTQTDFTQTITQELIDIVNIYPIHNRNNSKFVAVTKTGDLIVWGYTQGLRPWAYKLPSIQELVIAQQAWVKSSNELARIENTDSNDPVSPGPM